MEAVRISLCQINPLVGNLEENYKKIEKYIHYSIERGAKIICFPELSLIGYPPEDIVFYPYLLEKQFYYLEKLKKYKDYLIIIGFVNFKDNLYNSAAVLNDNNLYVYNKINLPNYSVFDEERYFKKGNYCLILESVDNIKIGLSICEDIWYPTEPLLSLVSNSVDLVINISASPYTIRKPKLREELLKIRALDYSVFIAFCNMVGGQDELVFDGSSLVIDYTGKTIAQAPSFEEYILFCDIPIEKIKLSKVSPKKISTPYIETKIVKINTNLIGNYETNTNKIYSFLDYEEEIFKACVLGTKDYVTKNNFEKVAIAISGGIDSSLVACIATEAINPSNILAIYMPSMFSSEHSLQDAKTLAQNLKINFKIIPIEKIYNSFIEILQDIYNELGNTEFTVAEENLQSRIRANIIMTLSNKFGYLVLTCGNKSEVSTGYSTLYGDTAGGFNPIKDLYKIQVYQIAKWYNSKRNVIPDRIFTKPPSAELRPNQIDQDTLPPYEILDKILKMYIEENSSPQYISEVLKLDLQYIKSVIKMVENAEYKRKQSPPGIKLSPKSFGKDRRFPITKKINF